MTKDSKDTDDFSRKFIDKICSSRGVTPETLIELEDRVVVLFAFNKSKMHNQNVECFSLNGEFLWRIEQTHTGGFMADPFTALEVDADQRLLVRSFQGGEYKLSPKHGRLEPLRFLK